MPVSGRYHVDNTEGVRAAILNGLGIGVSVPSRLPAAQIARGGSARSQASVVEVTLGNGRKIKIDATIDPATLARLVAALDGGAP